MPGTAQVDLQAIAEAQTVKHKARALLRDIEALLADKGLSEDETKPLAALRDRLKTRWSDLTAPESTAESLAVEATAILAQDDSYDGRRCAVQAALWRAVAASGGMMGEGPYPWIRDLYDDVVVFQLGDDLFRADYTIDADDMVTLGEPSKVEVSYVPVTDGVQETVAEPPPHDEPAPESAAESGSHEVVIEGDLIPLIEKAVKRDGTMAIKLIQPGWGASGFYPAEVLKRDGPKVFTKGLHSFWNHQTAQEAAARPEGDLRDLAAVLLSDAEWRDAGVAGPGLYATAKALNGYRESIEELAPHIGMSIRAFGKAATGEAEGRKGPIIEELTSGQSVDFVTAAGAGGEILQLFEAARGRATTTTEAPSPGERSSTVDEEQARALREANAANELRIQEQNQAIARLQEAILLRDAREFLTTTLRAIDMPDITRARLGESLLVKAPIKDGALDTAAYETLIRETAKGELAYLGQATGLGDGRIRGMGAAHITTDATAATESLAEALGALGGLTPELSLVAANGRAR